MQTLPERLKHARLERGLSQAELAAAAGVAQSTVGNIEAKHRKSAGSLPLLAAALKVNHAWLAWNQGPKDLTPSNAPNQTFSRGAIELAQLYDLIDSKKTIKRARAFTAAAEAIIKVLEDHAIDQQSADQKTPSPAHRS